MEDQKYKRLSEESDAYFEARISQVSTRAYEYGVLVVKNAFLVSGGGLFLTPAIVQITDSPDVKLAAYAGMLFATSVIIALIGNYVIHINWMLHEHMWMNHHHRDQILIRRITENQLETDEADLANLDKKIKKTNKWISRTFVFPHILTFLFLAAFIAGCVQLYRGLGIVT